MRPVCLALTLSYDSDVLPNRESEGIKIRYVWLILKQQVIFGRL